jgi:hypothetical protein
MWREVDVVYNHGLRKIKRIKIKGGVFYILFLITFFIYNDNKKF